MRNLLLLKLITTFAFLVRLSVCRWFALFISSLVSLFLLFWYEIVDGLFLRLHVSVLFFSLFSVFAGC